MSWPPPTPDIRRRALDRAQHRCQGAGTAGRPCTGSSSGLTLARLDPDHGPTLDNLRALCHTCAAAHDTASAPPAATPDTTAPLF